jgi:hypothetical protein
MLSLILAAWHVLRRRPTRHAFNPEALPWRRRAAMVEPTDPWPRSLDCRRTPPMPTVRQTPDSHRTLQLLMLQRLAQCGDRWAEMRGLGVDGAAPPLLDAMEQLADHGFVRLCVSRPQGGRATVLAARLLPKGAVFIAAYAVHVQPSTPVSAVPTASLEPAA